VTDAFVVDLSCIDDHMVLRFAGELDMQYASRAKDAGSAALSHANGNRAVLILDLADLSFCDSSGIAAFMQIAHEAEAQGHRLVLRNPKKNVRDLLRITGVDSVLTVEEARES
jgi:anti-anti-sigma factor